MDKEDLAREATTCPACDEDKGKGLVVCWYCFKYRDNNWKQSRVSFSEWLDEVRVEAQR